MTAARSNTRASILRLVRAAQGGLTASEVAAATGLHLSTSRAHLERLAAAGLLVKARASGRQRGRPAWRYRCPATLASPGSPPPAPYRELAAALLDYLSSMNGDVRATAAAAGQRWGRQLAAAHPRSDDPAQVVVGVLSRLGFSPRPQPAAPPQGVMEIHLATCPFPDLVASNPDAICALHLGLVRGILEQMGAANDPAVLDPFGAPAACVVRIPARSGDDNTGEHKAGEDKAGDHKAGDHKAGDHKAGEHEAG